MMVFSFGYFSNGILRHLLYRVSRWQQSIVPALFSRYWLYLIEFYLKVKSAMTDSDYILVTFITRRLGTTLQNAML